MVANSYHIGIVELGSLDRFSVKRCAVRALEIFQEKDRLHPNNPGVMARDGMVVENQIVVDLSPDGETVSSEIHRA